MKRTVQLCKHLLVAKKEYQELIDNNSQVSYTYKPYTKGIPTADFVRYIAQKEKKSGKAEIERIGSEIRHRYPKFIVIDYEGITLDKNQIIIGGEFLDLSEDGYSLVEGHFIKYLHLASYISRTRTINDVANVMGIAQERAGGYPHTILSDKLPAYPKGIGQIFGKRTTHLQSQGFSSDTNTNLIERFHSTLKERTKVLRGFKSTKTAELILDGFVVNYNFFRPHITLKDITPAQEAGVKLPFKTWEGLLRAI